MSKGKFKLNSKTKIIATDDQSRSTAMLLNDLLLKNYGFKLEVIDKLKATNVIEFQPKLNERSASRLRGIPVYWMTGNVPNEAYGLFVSSSRIDIVGSGTGQFYALQTLLQLLPADFKKKAELPVANIFDNPRFPYRGMHLDVARHFFPVEFVKKYIDLMAQYKFNYFHWHLTEDQGWRIEIKKYPRLTEIGSKRKETVKGRILNPYVGDGVPVEGFYTQEQIKDVVAYAKARYITVIPEIELPGHSSAALAAYPNLGCKENYEYKVQTTWGIFKEVYCPKEETFQFLEDVLAETISLFPDSPYIHIGGDEVLKDFWKESPFVQELKARENLKDEHEVQSYFVRRIEKFINSKGKRMIGWDEILEGGLAPNATVMSWRGMKGGIEAAKAKHDVIMTPTDFAYLDYGQGDPRTEPINIGGYLTLQKVYSFEPVPNELTEDERKYILGGQGNIWTEYLKKPEDVEYMAFPRMLALSEVVWSQLENRNFDDFKKRLSHQFARLDKQNVNYRIPEPVGLQNFVLSGEKDSAKIDLHSILPNGKIFYTTDGSEPTDQSKLYKKPLKLSLKPDEKVDLKTIVVNEKGRKSSVYGSTIWRRNVLKAVGNYRSVTNGMILALFKGEFKSVADFENARPTQTDVTKSFDFKQLGEKENFGVVWEAYLNVPATGIYEFQMESSGGAVLSIDNEKVVDLEGLHEKKSGSGDIPLAEGFHHFKLAYFLTNGENALNVRFGIKGQPLRGFANQLFR
jgi:hexosaminidase